MRKIFFLLLLLPIFGISQVCYVDNLLLKTDGDRGKAVSYTFSDDFKYGQDTVCGGMNGEECPIFEIHWEDNFSYTVDSDGKKIKEFEKVGEVIYAYQGMGFRFSEMIEHECSKESIDGFNYKLYHYLGLDKK